MATVYVVRNSTRSGHSPSCSFPVPVRAPKCGGFCLIYEESLLKSWGLMPEYRLYFKQRVVPAGRISRLYFVSSLNSVSYRHVQHISYICVFLTHTIHFLPKEKEPQDLPCYSKERGPKQMFPFSKSAQSIYADTDTVYIYIYIYIYIYAYNGRIT